MNQGLLLETDGLPRVIFTTANLGEQRNIVLHGYKEDYGNGLLLVDSLTETEMNIRTVTGCIPIQKQFLERIRVRFATPEDGRIIYRFVQELAAFEGCTHQVVTTENTFIRRLMSSRPSFQCLIATSNNIPIGFCLFYQTFSTWVGEGIHIDDLCIAAPYQGRGIGRFLLESVIRLAAERGFGRVELNVLDWNERAIALYEKIGMERMEGWYGYRLNRSEIRNSLKVRTAVNCKI